ncbi:MAG TPA: hypothetical protein VGI39_33250 [Polyangiaceae bacterium]|jgi:hypothetical protein
MGKKQGAVSLRKPPPADPDAFVNGAASAPAPATVAVASVVPTRAPSPMEGATVATRVGERREVTVYLPQDIARALSVRCVELDRDVSNLVAEALSKALANEEPMPEPALVPQDKWARARAVVDELRARFGLRLGAV